MMNRAAVREWVAGFGVILSLVFVAVQIRANTELTMAEEDAVVLLYTTYMRLTEPRRFEYPDDFAAYVDEVLIPLVRDEPIPRVIPRPAH